MSRIRGALCAVAVVGWVWLGADAAQARPPKPAAVADFGGEPASPAVRDLASLIAATGDQHGRPFALVDKKAARLYVFTPQAHLVGASPVLLGLAVGDRSAKGVGELPPARIPVADRTTPAGRFRTEPGVNLDGEAVVWFDYDAGLAIHRLRANAAEPARRRRLSTADPRAHRVSAGCVVVPVAFYESVVLKWLGRGHGTLYVLPEVEPVQAVFAGLERDL